MLLTFFKFTNGTISRKVSHLYTFAILRCSLISQTMSGKRLYVMDMSVYVTSMSVNPLVLGIVVQVSVSVVKMLAQVNLFVKMFVNPLVLISFQVNLFAITVSILLIHHCWLNRYFFVFFLFILIFSVHYKISPSNFYSLATVILLSKLTWFRKFIILHISRNSTFLRSNFNT